MAHIFCKVPLDHSRKETRFLRLLSADHDDDEIKAELFAASVEHDTPDFRAVSYAWNTQGPRKCITVNGDQFEVAETVYVLLRNIHSWTCCTRSMDFWIDSICINQENTPEKNVQVPLMKDIYTKASHVIVWLGDGNEYTDQAIAVMRNSSVWEKDLANKQEPLRTTEINTQTLQHFVDAVSIPMASFLKGINELFSREWFRRTWTLQEVVLSSGLPHVLCGRSALCWQCLTGTCTLFMYLFFPFVHAEPPMPLPKQLHGLMAELERFHRICHTYDLRVANSLRDRLPQLSQDAERLIELIWLTSRQLSTDPRDKIYGLLGMASDIERQRIRVDYAKPLIDVFVDAFCYLLSCKRGFQILSNAGVTGLNKHPRWPTWLPRFDDGPWKDSHEQIGGPLSRWSVYDSSLGLKSGYSLVDSGCLKLLLNGIFIDEVTEVTDASLHHPSRDLIRTREESIVKIFLSANRPCKSCSNCQQDAPGRCECPMYCPQISHSRCLDEEKYPISRHGESGSADFILSIEEHWRRIESWEHHARKPLTEAIWRAAIGDRLKDTQNSREHVPAPVWAGPVVTSLLPSLGSHDTEFFNSASQEDSESEDSESQNDDKSQDGSKSGSNSDRRHLRILRENMHHMVMGRRAFRTSNGFIGFGPKILEDGDKIVVIAGADVPLALRQRGEHFALVGECYVEGLMHGELLRQFPEFTNKVEEPSRMRLRQFVLV
ncbi:heterokaryon incompatibility protein-domain-containing protein [Hypoxylon rubiginosum]|uniref:Heterokaryon incompatibility protein-domain-containing protein n=1 Tax=Hypoxylon rubiginosum TaxID=110542 RepID=A0ACC0CMN4_9PEZI|nr:heterokaryon incompatibility protein-domain-containing protein [Hypoxylon rubiginosum]